MSKKTHTQPSSQSLNASNEQRTTTSVKQVLSAHRHISFTAHYTGYIWYLMGISHQAFTTSKGKRLTYLVKPLEDWAEKHIGVSMRSTLKQRHTMLDDQLHSLIKTHPDLQVLEIACGLSPRGWWFRKHYPHIYYRELDLPDMAKVKQEALAVVEENSLDVFAVDLFSPDFADIFHAFDSTKPLVVVSEGLINYFDQNLLAKLVSSLAQYGKKFPSFYFLTDLYCEPKQQKFTQLIWASSKLLKIMSRSAFSFHFKSPSEVKQFFYSNGFNTARVLQPSLYFQQQDNETKQQPNIPQAYTDEIEQKHHGDLLWTICATHTTTMPHS